MQNKRSLTKESNRVQEYIDENWPIKVKNIASISAMIGFRWLPKFIHNKTSAVPDKMAFSDWIGVFTTISTGLLTLNYFGTPGMKYWLMGQGIGNVAFYALYVIE